MPEKLRIGIIGAGNIVQSAHIPAFMKLENEVELKAVCDLNEERAREVGGKYGIEHVCRNMDELTSLRDVDAVTIGTWNNAHVDAVLSAAKAGKHILCEKPMAMTAAEAEKMADAVEQAGVTFMMGFVSRFRAESQILKELSEQGRFGHIYYAKASLLRRRGTPLGWFTDLSKSGGGPVIDIGVHIIDLTWYLMGKPKPTAVSAAVHHEIGDYKTKGVSRWMALDTDDLVFETEDSAAAFIRFENGATMAVEVSWAINGQEKPINATIYGSRAGANLDPLAVYGEEAGYLADTFPNPGETAPFVEEMRHFVSCVKEGRQPLASVYDGVQVQKMLNGIYQSAEEGREIQL